MENTRQRFGEPLKFLPVGFVLINILGLYLIYMILHAIPMAADPVTSRDGIVELVIFNLLACLLLTCYFRCMLVHPGTIPEKDVDPSWEFNTQERRTSDDGVITTEAKRSGDRRHCKWCAKYKPDRCHHCRVCRVCILRMDHHCPWIYNCVGFHNHKFFFLLLFYSCIATQMISWTMLWTVMQSVHNTTPFLTMFFLLFGETLGIFLAILITAFFSFHIWLMVKSMTTIEFCEKSKARIAYDSSVYDRGWIGNIYAVLGDNPWLWLLPLSPPAGDGMSFASERLLKQREAESNRAVDQQHDPLKDP